MALRFRVRLLVSMGLLIPLGLLMGIRRTSAIRSGIIPWIWAINGVTSVLGATLATALSIQAGLRLTLLMGLLYYGGAGLLMWAKEKATQRSEEGVLSRTRDAKGEQEAARA